MNKAGIRRLRLSGEYVRLRLGRHFLLHSVTAGTGADRHARVLELHARLHELPIPCHTALYSSVASVPGARWKAAAQRIGDMTGPWKSDDYSEQFSAAILALVSQKVGAGETAMVTPLEVAPAEAGSEHRRRSDRTAGEESGQTQAREQQRGRHPQQQGGHREEACSQGLAPTGMTARA